MAASRKPKDPVAKDSLVFEDPPPVVRKHRPKGKWEVAVDSLRKTPGRWAKFGPLKNPGSTLSSIKHRSSDVEGLTRTIDGEQYLYLRVVKR